jgi:hypothetical protein
MKTILISILILLNYFCQGQQQKTSNSEFSLFDQSNLWSVLDNYTSDHGPTDPNSYIKSSWYKIGNDTIINDVTYKNLLKSTDLNHEHWAGSGYLRPDGDRVYFLNKGREILLYDFGMAVGDIMESAIYEGFNYASRLDSIRSTTMQNTVRKIYYLTEYPAPDPGFKVREIWIEGIGSISNGLLRQTMLGLTLGAGWHDYYFLCFHQSESLIYQSKEYKNCFYDIVDGNDQSKALSKTKVYPNPVSDRLFIAINQPAKGDLSIEIYSMKGELIRKECFDSGLNRYQIDLSDLKSGPFLLRMIAASGKYLEEVIIKK